MHSIIQQIEQNLVLVEKGSFMMGSENGPSDERPVHKVTLARDLYIGKYLVTQAVWQAIMGENPSYFKGENRPVEQVSWDDTQVFFEKLNKLVNNQYEYRLPTEAEWEYAANGGNSYLSFKYSGSNKLKEVGWDYQNSHYESKPIGLKIPNELGIYDMTGNMFEWCEDHWHGNYEEAPNNGSAWLKNHDTKYRVYRGSNWGGMFLKHHRINKRSFTSSPFKNANFSFRIARF